MLYCGYQGCGKTTYCKNHQESAIDLDSSGFAKRLGWEEEYITFAQNLSNSENKDVFISAHQVVIEYLLKHKIDFKVLAPSMNKDAWKSRLEFRYHKNPTIPNLKAIRDFEENYEKDMAYYLSLEDNGVEVLWTYATVITNIEDLINNSRKA